MNWEEERFVKVYTKDTADWCLLSWEARATFLLMLRSVERAGHFKTRAPHFKGIAAVLRMPVEVVERVLPELAEDGCLIVSDDGVTIRNFLTAQEARQSGAARARDCRDRERERGRDSDNPGKLPPSSRPVTPRNTQSHEVTLDQNRLEQTRVDQTTSADALGGVNGGMAPTMDDSTEAPITARSSHLASQKKPTKAAKQDQDPALLTPIERGVYDAIVSDRSLQPIVKCPAYLAADLVQVAPGVDIAAAVCLAGAWLRANPTQRKSNGNQFLLAWAKRTQEKGPNVGTGTFKSNFTPVISPEVTRTLRFFGNRFQQETKMVYPAPTADARHAATLWADAVKGAEEATLHAKPGQFRPTAEDCAAYWITRFFKEDDRKIKDANYPFSWLVTRVGQYGLPKHSQASKASPSSSTVPVPSPRKEAPVLDASQEPPPVEFTAEFAAKLQSAFVIPTGPVTRMQSTIAKPVRTT